MALSQEEIERRMHALELARVDSQIEGQFAHPDDAAVLDAYARGEIDGDEFTRIILARVDEISKQQKKQKTAA